jgi:dienelactone hydrolase
MKPTFQVTPEIALGDEELMIKLGELNPGEIVTIKATLHDQIGLKWSSQAKFKVDSHGACDLSKEAPIEGGYDWVDSMGLIWSMQLTNTTQRPADLNPLGLDPFTIQFDVKSESGIALSKTVRRSWAAEGVKREVVRANGLFGTLFLPTGKGPHPALILVSGSGGGLNEPRAALLASHGYAAFALAYFNYETLPKGLVNIPLEYFQKAIHFLQTHPSIDSEKIGITGASRGGELSLLLGSTFTQFKVVVAYVPSAYIWAGLEPEGAESQVSWTWQGKPLAWVPDASSFNSGFSEMSQKGIPIPLTPGFLCSLEDAPMEKLEAAAIPVEKIKGAVLLISGEDDQMWPSALFSRRVMERLEKYHFPYPFKHLCYAGAGHAIGAPYTPLPPSHSIHPVDHNDYAYGGSPKEQSFAIADSWKQALQFLSENFS